LKDVAVDTLEALGYGVTVSDLYASRFAAVGTPHDFTHAVQEPFDYLAEQRTASAGNSYSAEIASEQRKLLEADVLLLNFPMWWFGAPAILKGWIDRVLAAGFAYDRDSRFETGRFRGKRGMLTVTTGSVHDRYSKDGPLAFAPMQETLHPLNRGVLEYIGMRALEPFVAYGVTRLPDAERQGLLDAYRTHLTCHIGA
jgi:NAD(P)H dehydrogenase (quinone)